MKGDRFAMWEIRAVTICQHNQTNYKHFRKKKKDYLLAERELSENVNLL